MLHRRSKQVLHRCSMILGNMLHRRSYDPSLFCVSLISRDPGSGMAERHGNKMGMISDAIARYDDEHSFARSVTLPEEDRAKYTSVGWEGGYRWFRSPNVTCLEKARRVRPLVEGDYFERL